MGSGEVPKMKPDEELEKWLFIKYSGVEFFVGYFSGYLAIFLLILTKSKY